MFGGIDAGGGAATANLTHGMVVSNFPLVSRARAPTVYCPAEPPKLKLQAVAVALGEPRALESHAKTPHDPLAWSHRPDPRSRIATSTRDTPTSSVALPEIAKGPIPWKTWLGSARRPSRWAAERRPPELRFRQATP